jgi:hypothetical protein
MFFKPCVATKGRELIMFHFRRITGWISSSLLVLLFVMVGASGQVEKTKTQTPATTRAERVSPLAAERGADSKGTSPVIVPSEPLVRILRLMRLTALEDPIVNKSEDTAIAESALEPMGEPGCLSFIFCGSHAVSAEDFATSYCWDATPPIISESPAPQVPSKNTVATKKTGGLPPAKSPKVVRQ